MLHERDKADAEIAYFLGLVVSTPATRGTLFTSISPSPQLPISPPIS